MRKKLTKKYISGLTNLIISLVVSTIIIYAINIIAGFAGADYSFSNGEVFVIWILKLFHHTDCFGKRIYEWVYAACHFVRSIIVIV